MADTSHWILDMGHGWNPRLPLVPRPPKDHHSASGLSVQRQFVLAVLNGDKAAVDMLLPKCRDWATNPKKRSTINTLLCQCPNVGIIQTITEMLGIAFSPMEGLRNLMMACDVQDDADKPDPAHLRTALEHVLRLSKPSKGSWPTPTPGKHYPPLSDPSWDEWEDMHDDQRKELSYNVEILEIYALSITNVNAERSRSIAHHDLLLQTMEQTIPSIAQDVLRHPGLSLAIFLSAMGNGSTPPFNATEKDNIQLAQQWWQRHATQAITQEMFESLLTDKIMKGSYAFDAWQCFDILEGWAQDNPSVRQAFADAQAASAAATQTYEQWLSSPTWSSTKPHPDKHSNMLAAHLSLTIDQAMAHKHLQQELDANNGDINTPCSLSSPLLAYPSLLQTMLGTGLTQRTAIKERLLATPQGAEAVGKCLQNPLTLKAWLNNVLPTDMLFFLRRCPSLATWTDAHGNTPLHWYAGWGLMSHDQGVVINQTQLGQIQKLAPQWLTQSNHQGVSALDILAASKMITPSTHAVYSKKILTRMVKKAGANKTQQQPKHKRKM